MPKKTKKQLLAEQAQASAEGDIQRVTELEADLNAEEKEEDDLNWKTAAIHLKEAIADTSIDRYYKKKQIAACRNRFNNRERTPALYEEIMGL